jgi:hypothetical protein
VEGAKSKSNETRIGFRISPGWSLAPAGNTPKNTAKENRPAPVHPCGVTELVSEAGVSDGIDGDVAPDQEVGKRHGHESTLQDATAKAGRPCIAFEGGGDPIEDGPNGKSQQQEQNESKQDSPPTLERRRLGLNNYVGHYCESMFFAQGKRQEESERK